MFLEMLNIHYSVQIAVNLKSAHAFWGGAEQCRVACEQTTNRIE